MADPSGHPSGTDSGTDDGASDAPPRPHDDATEEFAEPNAQAAPTKKSAESAEADAQEAAAKESAESAEADAQEAAAKESEESAESGEPDAQEAPTEEIAPPNTKPQPPPITLPADRRFTAPSGFDAGATEKIDPASEPITEVLSVPTEPVARPATDKPLLLPPRSASPQSIPPRGGSHRRYRSWGWVLALILVIAALAAVVIFGTVWLTRGNAIKASPEDQVRTTIENFDIAVQKGDLATLRAITCGTTGDGYVNYDARAWATTYARVAAAKQYPVVTTVDEVVVDGDHAEANVTTFMADDPATRSTRSFELQFRDDQWKICQATNG